MQAEEQAVFTMDPESARLREAGPSSSEFAPATWGSYAHKRVRVDNWATVAFLLFVSFTFVASFVIFSQASAEVESPYFYLNSATCDAKSYNELVLQDPSSPPPPAMDSTGSPTFGTAFQNSVSIWIPISTVLALTFSVGYIFLFRHHAEKMVFGTIIASLGLSLLWAIVALAAGAIPGGVILLVITLVLAAFYWFIREDLKMCAKLLAVSGKALLELPHLVSAALLTKLAGVVILLYMFIAMLSSAWVGYPVENPAWMTREIWPNNVQATCKDEYGNQVDCCIQMMSGWGAAYMFISACTIAWTAQVILQVKLYVVADTVSQWYWAPPGTHTQGPSVKLAARHALTTGFGSCAFAGLVVAVIQTLRAILRRQARENIICCIINCIAQPLLAIAEIFTKFTTVACAITGQPFITAGRQLFDTLKRNFLPTFTLWWIPEMVLNSSVFLISLCWAVIVYFATYLQHRDKLGDDAIGCAFAVAACAFALVLFVLFFMAGLLLDIVNTIYICWSLDRDAHRENTYHPYIAEIYMQLPTVKGALIEQPDQSLAYGAPQQQAQPQVQVVQMHPTSHPQQQYVGYDGYTPTNAYGAPAYPAYGAPATPAAYPPAAYPPAAYPPAAYPPAAYPPAAYPPPGMPGAQPAYGGYPTGPSGSSGYGKV